MIGRDRHVDDDLTALLDGALPGDRRAEVETHLASCQECRSERDRIARALSALSLTPPPPAPPPGFEQRFYARLARETPRHRSLLDRLAARPLRWLVPSTGLAALLVAGIWIRHADDRSDLEMARHLDLLENYVEVASLGVVETSEDVDVVSHLDELREGGTPVILRPVVAALLLLASSASLAQAPAQGPAQASPSQAAPAPGGTAGERWEKLSPAEKDVLRKRWKAFQEMTPERQAELRARLEHWRSLPAAERGEIASTWKRFRQLAPDERREMLQMLNRYKEMTPGRQAQVRELFRKMVDAPPEMRQRYLDNLERWKQMTPAQRDQARDMWRQKRQKP